MAVAEKIAIINNSINTMKSNLGLSENASLNEVVTATQGGGGGGGYTGHVDVEGLTALGWTNEEIQDLQDNGVFWNEEDDDIYKVKNYDIEGSVNSSMTVFLKKSHSLTSSNTFQNYYSLKAIHKTTIPTRSSVSGLFNGCYNLRYVPEMSYGNATNYTYLFQNCYSLKKVGKITLTASSNCGNMFLSCESLTEAPEINYELVNSATSMFNGCISLKHFNSCSMPLVATMGSMFSNCKNLIKTGYLDTPSLKGSLSSMFLNCYSLVEIGGLNTHGVINFGNTFMNCYSLETVPLLDLSSANTVNTIFTGCKKIINLGGFKDLGKGYNSNQPENYSYYSLNLSPLNNLTHESLMNVINNLYDIKSAGVKPQSLILGSINLAKLTDEEKQIAIDKGWNLS